MVIPIALSKDGQDKSLTCESTDPQEEEEADFKKQFPDHGQAFADVAEMEGDDSMLTVPDHPQVSHSPVNLQTCPTT